MSGREIKVFISHSWASGRQYRELQTLLDSIPDLNWYSVSVTRDRPLATYTQGEPAQQQELQLQRAKLERHSSELHDLELALRRHEQQSQNAERARGVRARLKREFAEAEESLFSAWMIRRLEEKHGKTCKEMQDMMNAPEPELASPSELAELENRRVALSRRVQACERRIAQIREDSGLGVTLIHYSSRDIMYGGKIEEGAIETDRNLALMLEAQIAAADVMIVIGEMYAQYRKWMACELALAQSLLKPVLTVIPLGQKACPVELRVRSHAVVSWDEIELGKSLILLQEREKAGEITRGIRNAADV